MSTVTNVNIVGTKTGPELVTEIALQIGNTDTELDLRPEAAQPEAISGDWTFSGIPIFSGLPSFEGVSGTDEVARFIQGNLEAGHSTKHEIRVRMSGTGIVIGFTPWVDGVDFNTHRLAFDFGNEHWLVASDLRIDGDILGGAQTLQIQGSLKWGTDDIWHAGNFTPSSKSDTSHTHDLNDSDDVNTAGLGSGDIMEWSGSEWIMVIKPTGSGSTNLSKTLTATTVKINSDTGLDTIISEADGVNAGIFSVAQHDSLDTVIADMLNAVKDTDFGSNGLCVRTAANTYNNRSIVQGQEIVVTNGNGVSGNPTIALARDITSGTGAASAGSNGDLHFRHAA